MTTKVRGYNPIWANFDLQGLIFDDSFYLYVLENIFPYLPSDQVFLDINGENPAPSPIQFLANGTLPVNIFFTPGVIYRLEFRKNDGTQPPSQNDALIYLVENYKPTGSGSGPSPGLSVNSDNQISNPQFPIISFSSPHTFTSISNTTVNIAPDWDVVVTGSGDLTVEQQALTASDVVPTNAPYGLLVTTTGFATAYLRQRFNENGTIWSSSAEQINAISTSITARTNDTLPHIMALSLVNNATPEQFLPIESYTLTTAWQEFRHSVAVPPSTNTSIPPAAYTELRIGLPATGSVAVTSIQIMGQDAVAELPFEQETVARQIDHTFHFYRDSILFQPKESLLVGGNWSLNPWQGRAITSATLASRIAYTADQTIIFQQTNTSRIAVGRGTVANNTPLNITAVESDNRFAVIEYIDPLTIQPYWGQKLSALLRAKITTTHGSAVRVKMRLIHRESLPSTIGTAEPISSWSGSGDPVFSAGWTALTPVNDPAYTLIADYDDFVFEKFQLPASSNANMTLGMVLYTIDEMDESSTADSIQFERCSLVPNEFAIDANVLTFDENLSRCQYYYEKSYELFVAPGTVTDAGSLLFAQPIRHTGSSISHDTVYRFPFEIIYHQIKRDSPTNIFYSPASTSAGLVRMKGLQGTTTPSPLSGSNPDDLAITGWTASFASRSSVMMINNVTTSVMSFASGQEANQQATQLHYVANSRLGR
jgi:hypothetical protein